VLNIMTQLEQPSSPMSKSVKPAKKYDEAFKRQAVENWIRSNRPGTQIAHELGISYPALKDWRRRYSGESTPDGPDLNAEVRMLRAELARVREQRDILKKRWASSRNPNPTLRTDRSDETRAFHCLDVRRFSGEPGRLLPVEAFGSFPEGH